MENSIENHSAEISAEEKIRIFDLACEKYIEGREAGAGEWSKGKTWNSPQEYMGYAVYKSLIDSGALVLAVATQQKIKG